MLEYDPEDALALCDDILNRLEDLPDQAAEFAESIYDKASGMRDWIEEHGHVTIKMYNALENIQHGVLRWFD